MIENAKPGRNEPCPCGSGKKYKKCCLAADELKARALMEQAEAAFLEKQEKETRPVANLKQEYQEAMQIMADCLDEAMMSGKEIDSLKDEESKMTQLYEKFVFSRHYGNFFTDYMVLDCGVGDPEKTVAQRFIESGIGERTSDELEQRIKDLSDSSYSFYEALIVRVKSAELIDIFSNKIQIVRWDDSEPGPPFGRKDIIFARIAGSNGSERVIGDYFNFGGADRDFFGEKMECYLDEYTDKYPERRLGKDFDELYTDARKMMFPLILEDVFTMLKALVDKNKRGSEGGTR